MLNIEYVIYPLFSLFGLKKHWTSNNAMYLFNKKFDCIYFQG